jgi:thiol-disulfide isomerase/thioredoxin
MKSKWIIAAAAALALGLLTLPSLTNRHGSTSTSASAATPASASSEDKDTCDGTGTAKLDFVLKDMNNVPVKLAEFKGHVVLINFWATWCGPCKEEIPTFVEMYNKYRSKGLVILGVSIDDSPAQLQAFAKEWHMQYPLLQMQTEVEDTYGPFFGIPTSYFIARNGSICKKHLGPVTKDEFERELKALL